MSMPLQKKDGVVAARGRPLCRRCTVGLPNVRFLRPVPQWRRTRLKKQEPFLTADTPSAVKPGSPFLRGRADTFTSAGTAEGETLQTGHGARKQEEIRAEEGRRGNRTHWPHRIPHPGGPPPPHTLRARSRTVNTPLCSDIFISCWKNACKRAHRHQELVPQRRITESAGY